MHIFGHKISISPGLCRLISMEGSTMGGGLALRASFGSSIL